MVNHPKAVNMVEAIVREGKTFLTIGNFKSASHAEQTKALPCELYGLRRQVHSGISCSIPCELETIRAYTTPDFQDILPTKGCEPSHGWYVPVATAITFSGNVFEIPTAVLFRR